MFSFFKKKETPVVGMTAQPLVITQGPAAMAPDKIEHAKYRLHAIQRTIEQHPDKITAAHMAEFKREVRDHAHTLVQAGVISDEQAAELVRHGKGANY